MAEFFDDTMRLQEVQRKIFNLGKPFIAAIRGYAIGGGFEIKTEKRSFFIEGRYHLGLRNISKDYQVYESMKANTLVVVAGFKI